MVTRTLPTAAGTAAAAGPAGSQRPLLAVRDAARAFGAVQALRGVSLSLGAGELLALLGPNGAGKTTLIRTIAGRVRLDRGTVEMFGQSVSAGHSREGLGVVPQEIALYPLLTARENLDVFGRLHGVAPGEIAARIAWALEWTGLGEPPRDIVRGFSGGMKRRLNIACAVLHRPRVVLLDEPTAGVDPQSRERIYDMLAGLRSEGAALLLTTHQLEEAEQRCDRVVIVDHGDVIAAGTVRELIARTLGTARRVVIVTDRALPGAATATGGEVQAAMPDLPRASDSHNGAHVLEADLSDLGNELPRLIEQVRAAGARIEDVRIERRGLHDVFLHLTGKELRE